MMNRWEACVFFMLTVVGVAAAAPTTTWDRVFSEQQAVEGETIYQDHCATCHGSNLEGGEDAPPLVGAQFSTVWEGRTLGDLLASIQTRMPADDPGLLDRVAYTDIVA